MTAALLTTWVRDVVRTTWSLGLVLLAGCGTAPPAGPAPAGDAGPEASELTLPDASPPQEFCQGPCPATPTATGPCIGGSQCTYGNDPRFECRILRECLDGHWVTRTLPLECLAAPVTPCPETTDAQGTSCTPPSSCNVADGRCHCFAGTWICNRCAPQNLGEACDKNDRWCDGAPTCSNVSCLCGRWTAVLHTCE